MLPGGGLSIEVHLRRDRKDRPLRFHLTGGEAADKAIPLLPDGWSVRRAGPGRPRRRPERLVADRAYGDRHVRDGLRRRRIGVAIPRPRRRRPRFAPDRRAYRERDVVERLVARLKRFRRAATRYEKRAANHLAMLRIAAIVLWLRV